MKITEISETSLELFIPSFPGSPRSLSLPSQESYNIDAPDEIMRAVDFLHHDNDFLLAAETGNNTILEILIRIGTNVQQTDHLGRNALHLAVCADNHDTILLLLKAGVDTNVKDDIGMTPLYLNLMRNPSLKIAHLLFDYGAKILPRMSPMDTGLFIQFVMMCTPTLEEAKILRLLITKGALIDDPDAPGGRQALHFAAMSNNCDLIRILLKLGADLFLTNHRDEIPKEVAQSFQCKEAAAFLAEMEDETSGTSIKTTASSIKSSELLH